MKGRVFYMLESVLNKIREYCTSGTDKSVKSRQQQMVLLSFQINFSM